jgi:hypothetical protein
MKPPTVGEFRCGLVNLLAVVFSMGCIRGMVCRRPMEIGQFKCNLTIQKIWLIFFERGEGRGDMDRRSKLSLW